MSANSLTWPAKFAYGLGKFPDVIKLKSFDLFILFFYSQVLGLPGSLAGLAIFLVICADAVWDPIVGTISDGLRNAPLGRRLTPMAAAAIPAGLSFWLLFSPPTGLGHGALFAWLLGTAVLLRCSMTFYQIPYVSLQAELSDQRSDRATLLVISSLVRMVTEFTLLWAAFNLFFNAAPGFPNGQQDPSRYPRYGEVMGLVMGAGMLLSAAILTPAVRRMRTFAASSPNKVSGLLRPSLWRSVLTGNGDYRALVATVLLFAVANGVHAALTLYLGTYLYKLTPPQMAQWVQILLIFSFISLIVLVPWVVKRLEVRRVFLLTMIGYASVEAGMVAIYLSGLWPPHWPLLWLLYAGNACAGVIIAGSMVAPPLMCSIAVDDHELRSGQPQQGLMFGIVHFSQKAGAAVGNLIAGVFIDLVHFPKGAPASAIGLDRIAPVAWFYVCALLSVNVLAWLALRGYRLRHADHDKVVLELEQRRMAAVSAAAS